MRLKDGIDQIIKELSKLYDEAEAAAIAELVMEKITGSSKNELTGKKNIDLDTVQINLLDGYLERLARYEPVQYVLNEAFFCGLKFYVDKNVLIPRPETEELVEWIIAGCKFPVDELSILDVGTGSGCIPISLKRRIRKAKVSSIDISPAAISVAQKNANELGADVNFIEMDFLDDSRTSALPAFDIIVSNPPYIPAKDSNTLSANVLEYEPGAALFVPDNDPVIFYKTLAEFGKKHLDPGGTIYAEMHEDYHKEVEEFFRSAGYQVEVKKDMQGKYRMLKAR